MSQEIGGPKRGKEIGEWLVGGAVRIQDSIYLSSLQSYVGMVHDTPNN